MASTRRACATAVNSWRGGSGRRAPENGSCRGLVPHGLKLSDSRAALPLPASGERSEFARSSRKFGVRGLLRESELRGIAPSLSRESALVERPLTPTLSPPAGRGSRKDLHSLLLNRPARPACGGGEANGCRRFWRELHNPVTCPYKVEGRCFGRRRHCVARLEGCLDEVEERRRERSCRT